MPRAPLTHLELLQLVMLGGDWTPSKGSQHAPPPCAHSQVLAFGVTVITVTISAIKRLYRLLQPLRYPSPVYWEGWGEQPASATLRVAAP